MSKVTQLTCDRAKIGTQEGWLQSRCFGPPVRFLHTLPQDFSWPAPTPPDYSRNAGMCRTSSVGCCGCLCSVTMRRWIGSVVLGHASDRELIFKCPRLAGLHTT